MELIKGFTYNLKGLIMGLTTPKLFFLGIFRVLIVIIFTLLLSAFIFTWNQEILNLIWAKPESYWMIILWKAVSWIVSIFLAAGSGIVSYIAAQLMFAVFIMDYMSKITEEIVLGRRDTNSGQNLSMLKMFGYLVIQEIPRAVIPLFLMFFITIIGFLTPLGPVIAFISSCAAVAFLAWDNTDLVPARRMFPFNKRFLFFKKHILFHIGFGLCFMIPWLNILFLSFAPVGATLYFLDNNDAL